jgi:hypothetical protein
MFAESRSACSTSSKEAKKISKSQSFGPQKKGPTLQKQKQKRTKKIDTIHLLPIKDQNEMPAAFSASR